MQPTHCGTLVTREALVAAPVRTGNLHTSLLPGCLPLEGALEQCPGSYFRKFERCCKLPGHRVWQELSFASCTTAGGRAGLHATRRLSLPLLLA